MDYRERRPYMLSYRSVNPIRIAAFQGSEFAVDEDELHSLLTQEKLQGLPLSIIAVAGKFRTGKSFLLNFFIRYFRNKGWQNPDWIGSDNKRVDEGFSWKAGSERHTKGIDVWPEPFFVESMGRKIAVLLVDTQGLFDMTTSPDTNAKILGLSTLFSSHQIINIKDLINETDLEHLELCVNYAQAAQSRSAQERGNTGATFQAITLLIRDWVFPQDYPHGSTGGGKYLRSVLESAGCERKVAAVKKSIKSAFASTRGFLMPHPGLEMVELPHEKVSNADIRPIFLKTMEELTEHILNPRNLIIKKERGLEVTAVGLMTLITTVGKAFESGRMPTIETMLESAIMASNIFATTEGLRAYRTEMEKNGKILKAGDFEKLHTGAMKTADQVFWGRANFGPQTKREAAHRQFLKELEQNYDFFKRKNKLNQGADRLTMDAAFLGSLSQYDRSMKRLTRNNNIVSDYELETIHLREKSKAMDKFEAETGSCTFTSKVASRRIDLEDGINTICEDVRAINEQNKTMAEKNRDEDKLIVEAAFPKSSRQYETSMRCRSVSIHAHGQSTIFMQRTHTASRADISVLSDIQRERTLRFRYTMHSTTFAFAGFNLR